MISRIRNFFYGWQTAYYEIKNWFFVKSIIRKHSKTADWENFNLRSDWVGRIYTVLNPQSPGDDGDTDDVLRIKYAERLRPINLYLDKLGLGESVSPGFEKIPDSKSYLFIYTPLFRVITFGKIFFWSLVLGIFFFSKLDTFTWNGILWVWNHVANLLSQIF
jgi:hypothetical protein